VRCIGTQFLVEVIHLKRSLRISATGSQVPYQSLNRVHATFMPVASRTVSRLSSDLIPHKGGQCGFDDVWMTHDTSSAVHLRSSPRFIPDGFTPPFSLNVHHEGSLPTQLEVVCDLRLHADHERPTLIFDKASKAIAALLPER